MDYMQKGVSHDLWVTHQPIHESSLSIWNLLLVYKAFYRIFHHHAVSISWFQPNCFHVSGQMSQLRSACTWERVVHKKVTLKPNGNTYKYQILLGPKKWMHDKPDPQHLDHLGETEWGTPCILINQARILKMCHKGHLPLNMGISKRCNLFIIELISQTHILS